MAEGCSGSSRDKRKEHRLSLTERKKKYKGVEKNEWPVSCRRRAGERRKKAVGLFLVPGIMNELPGKPWYSGLADSKLCVYLIDCPVVILLVRI